MKFINWLKALSPARYFQSTITEIPGLSNGAKPRPFNVDAALRQFKGWAYAAAMMNANAVANVPLRLYVRRKPGAKAAFELRPVPARQKSFLRGDHQDRPSRSTMAKVAAFGGDVLEVAEPHPVLEVMRTVNPFANGYELTVLRMLDLQLAGNSYLHVIGDAAPREVWRMSPNMTWVIPSKTDWIGGFAYGFQPNQRKFPTSEVIQFKMPNPADHFYGKGWFEAGWDSLSLHASKREMDQAKFDNMARPDWLATVKQAARKDALDEFENKIRREFGGAAKSGKFLAVNADVELKALNWEVEEAGTPTRVIEEISAVSGVPVAMLLSNDPTKAGSTTARTGWYRSTIRPYCRLDEEKLNEQWVTKFPGAEDMFVAYDQVSFEDEEAQAKRLIGLVSGGILAPNEARAEIGYDATEDGDDLFRPAGGIGSGGASAVGGDAMPGQNDEQGEPNPANPSEDD